MMLHKRGRGGFAVLPMVLLVAVLWGTLAPAASADEPTPTPAPGVPAEGVHTVQAGDTLYSIANKYGVTVDQLLDWNDIPDPRQIKPGQKIAVKEPTAIEAASQPSSDEEVSVAIRGRSISWSTSVRTIVIFGAIFLVLIVMLSVVDRFRK